MSREEELLQAILDGNTVDFTPRSRVEQFLKNCVEGCGCDGLPTPRCRSEVLLYALAEKMAGGNGSSGGSSNKLVVGFNSESVVDSTGNVVLQIGDTLTFKSKFDTLPLLFVPNEPSTDADVCLFWARRYPSSEQDTIGLSRLSGMSILTYQYQDGSTKSGAMYLTDDVASAMGLEAGWVNPNDGSKVAPPTMLATQTVNSVFLQLAWLFEGFDNIAIKS